MLQANLFHGTREFRKKQYGVPMPEPRTPRQAKSWEKLAAVPAETFEREVSDRTHMTRRVDSTKAR